MTQQVMANAPVAIEGSWEREARRVTMLAQELGMALDDEALLWNDMRELVTLRLRLQEALNRTRRGSPRWPRFAPRPQDALRENVR